jgi:hypothetical protein
MATLMPGSAACIKKLAGIDKLARKNVPIAVQWVQEHGIHSH